MAVASLYTNVELLRFSFRHQQCWKWIISIHFGTCSFV